MAELTPMMRQYMKTKEKYKDCILFYRLGDFYEMFFDDAKTVSKELELTLTGKSCGLEERAPMCGIPYHAVDSYLDRLVSKGYKVAICEQMEDPKEAKGLVARDVIRVVTPGTNLIAADETKNNYLMCIVSSEDDFGVSTADITTGDYLVTEVHSKKKLIDEINKFSPAEIVTDDEFLMEDDAIKDLRYRLNITVYTLEPRYFDAELCRTALLEHFRVSDLSGLGMREMNLGAVAAGALLRYLYDTQKSDLPHLTGIKPYTSSRFMVIDSSTRRNLELTETMREKQKRGSLLWVLDRTKTAMGARMLRSMIEQPLIEPEEIENRLEAVSQLKDNAITREEIREYLNSVYDLERLSGRISYKSANPRDLIAFRNSLEMLPHIHTLLSEFTSPLLLRQREELDDLSDIKAIIDAAVNDDPPVSLRDGGIIKPGYNADVDRYRAAGTEGKSWLAEIEEKERQKTGIKNLKIKYNKVFGYYLEVTNSFKDLVPEDWMRKQTLTGSERYITGELKELEETILGAEERVTALEYALFCEVRDRIADEIRRIQKTAKAVACIDVLASLAYVAEQYRYVRPTVNTKGKIDIKGGRHPVVERMSGDGMFIPNNTKLDNDDNRIAIITGPNMAGKSTYMRQTALIVLMAQLGSFVPAEKADIGIVDRIFTRVGASDDLASGQSTFMVEMTEVANILRNATADSLLILDEIGRGTSTFDGLSIAWAVIEYISDKRVLGSKTLFATHYHELTELEGSVPGVTNYCIAVKEKGEDIVFLRKIIRGGADRSYGIQVARLAGVPDPVLKRAKELAAELSANDISAKPKAAPPEEEPAQIALFDTLNDDNIIEEIGDLDLGKMTPIDALNTLYRIQNKIRNRW